MYIESFKQLTVWQRAIEVVKEVYRVTESFPKTELYGLVSQMRRSAVSIPANIAESKKRRTKKDFIQFLRVADGSGAELETMILIAQDLFPGIDFRTVSSLLEEVQKMLTVMIRKLDSSKS